VVTTSRIVRRTKVNHVRSDGGCIRDALHGGREVMVTVAVALLANAPSAANHDAIDWVLISPGWFAPHKGRQWTATDPSSTTPVADEGPDWSADCISHWPP